MVRPLPVVRRTSPVRRGVPMNELEAGLAIGLLLAFTHGACLMLGPFIAFQSMNYAIKLATAARSSNHPPVPTK